MRTLGLPFCPWTVGLSFGEEAHTTVSICSSSPLATLSAQFGAQEVDPCTQQWAPCPLPSFLLAQQWGPQGVSLGLLSSGVPQVTASSTASSLSPLSATPAPRPPACPFSARGLTAPSVEGYCTGSYRCPTPCTGLWTQLCSNHPLRACHLFPARTLPHTDTCGGRQQPPP